MAYYIFFRAEGFYPIEVPDYMLRNQGEEKIIGDNVQLNPGTLKVETPGGRVVWEDGQYKELVLPDVEN